LKPAKKKSFTHDILEVSNDHSGNFSNNHQLELKRSKKLSHTFLIFDVSNDQVGKLVIAPSSLK
jgi:hypothetical protein